MVAAVAAISAANREKSRNNKSVRQISNGASCRNINKNKSVRGNFGNEKSFEKVSREERRRSSAAAIEQVVKGASSSRERKGHFWRWKEPAKIAYADIRVQVLVAILISGNFLANVIEKQIWPTGEVCDLESHECTKDSKCSCRQKTLRYKMIFAMTDLIFNVLFSIELSWNMYGNWFQEFWSSGWNIFDFITVFISWLMMIFPKLPGPLKMLRMVRALRVFRLFKRVQSLKRILESLVLAIPGVINAFLIMLIVMCIYAILAVDFFQNQGKDGIFHFESGFTKTRLNDNFLDSIRNTTTSTASASSCSASPHFWLDNFDGTGITGQLPNDFNLDAYISQLRLNVDGSGTYYTARNAEWGHEYFGNFGKSLFTLFQILTGDSWAEAIGRPLLQGWNPLGTAIFFISFILLHSVVLINVVVAVLLEKMVTPDEDEENEDEENDDEPIDDVFFQQISIPQIKSNLNHTIDAFASKSSEASPTRDSNDASTNSCTLQNIEDDDQVFHTGITQLNQTKSDSVKTQNLQQNFEARSKSATTAKVHPVDDVNGQPSPSVKGSSRNLLKKNSSRETRDITVYLASLHRDLQKNQSEIEILHKTVNTLVDTQTRLLHALEKHGITSSAR